MVSGALGCPCSTTTPARAHCTSPRGTSSLAFLQADDTSEWPCGVTHGWAAAIDARAPNEPHARLLGMSGETSTAVALQDQQDTLVRNQANDGRCPADPGAGWDRAAGIAYFPARLVPPRGRREQERDPGGSSKWMVMACQSSVSGRESQRDWLPSAFPAPAYRRLSSEATPASKCGAP